MRSTIRISRYLATVFAALFALIGMAFGALQFVGTTTDAIPIPRTMAKEQAANPLTLVFPGDLKYWAAFKLPRIADDRPEIILVGSSRGGQLRSAMFRPYKFYNAAFTAWNLKQYIEMIDHITRVSKPRIIILSLDFNIFTDVYASAVNSERTMYFDNDLRFRFDNTLQFIKALADRPSTLAEYIYPRLLGRGTAGVGGLKLVGIQAINKKVGFRSDGSFLYSADFLLAAPEFTKNNKGLLDAAPGGPRIDPQQMANLERLAALARERGIQLVGIQLPILKASLDVLNNDASYHYYAGVWREFQSPAMRDKLRELGIEFFDLCCVPIVSDSRNFIDAAHLGERGMLTIVTQLFEDPRFRSLFPKLDIAGLRLDLADAQEKGEFFNVYYNRF